MVATRLPRRRSGPFSISRTKFLALVVATIFLVFQCLNQLQTSTSYDYINTSSAGERRRSMMEWRDFSKEECGNLIKTIGKNVHAEAADQKEALERSFMSKMTLNQTPSTTSASKDNPYRRCRNTFIDLGTNIGDSIGYFVDNAIDVCSPMWVEAYPKTRLSAKFPRPHLDVMTLNFKHRGSTPNPLFGLLQRQTKALPSATSESFCLYGVEGNPVFTDRLTKLENFISDMNPRPVQHVHIFTRSVVTASNGPTKLFLDKISVEQNFWGSSILSSQQDAVKSAKELNGGDFFSADVAGITLSSMVQSTMLALEENVSPEDQSGGILIVKMDIEGAEYQVLKEVAASDVLCKLTSLGNRVVLVIEYHNMSITDAQERRREKDGHADAIKKLEHCGVEFQKLHALWA